MKTLVSLTFAAALSASAAAASPVGINNEFALDLAATASGITAAERTFSGFTDIQGPRAARMLSVVSAGTGTMGLWTKPPQAGVITPIVALTGPGNSGSKPVVALVEEEGEESVPAVPLPGTAILFASALLLAGAMATRRRPVHA